VSRRDYFSDDDTDANRPLTLVPAPLTAAMIVRAMQAAISAYSIAVAPDASTKKRIVHLWKSFRIHPSP